MQVEFFSNVKNGFDMLFVDEKQSGNFIFCFSSFQKFVIIK